VATEGRKRWRMLRWARKVEALGKRFLEIAAVYCMLVGALMLVVVVLGAC